MGKVSQITMRPARAKALTINAFALAGRCVIINPSTQGVALGYVLVGLSARFVYVLNQPPYASFPPQPKLRFKYDICISDRSKLPVERATKSLARNS